MLMLVGLVNALSLHESLKGGFIGSFVDIGAASHAPEISRSFLKLMLLRRRLHLLLLCQEILDDLCSRQLLGNWLVWLCRVL